MTTQIDPDALAQPARAAKSLADIAALFAVLGGEDEAIALVDVGLTQLRQVQQAKTALGRLSTTELRAALQRRKSALEESA